MRYATLFANPVGIGFALIVIFFFSKQLLKLWYMFTKPAGSMPAKQASVDSIPLHIPSLPNRTEFYQTIADSLETDMQHMGTNTGPMFDKLEKLSTEELIAVWKAFGVRDNKVFGITSFSGNLGEWFDAELRDIWEGNNLKKMHGIWAKTGLW